MTKEELAALEDLQDLLEAKDKRIAELEAVIAEFIHVESEGGAEYEHITREAMEASLQPKGSEGGGDEEDRLIKKLLNEPQSLRTAKILIKEIVSLKGGGDE